MFLVATVSHPIRDASSGRVIRDGVELSGDKSLLGLDAAIKKSLKDTCHLAIQLHHGSLNRKKITRPEEASRMRCDTVTTKNSMSRWPELYNNFVNRQCTYFQYTTGPLLVMIFNTAWTCMQNLHWQVQIIDAYICDTIWENWQHVIKGNFAETVKLVVKLLFFFDFNNP